MARDLILGQIPADVACAIALGFEDNHRVVVTPEAITLFDERLRTSRTQPGWLDSDDPLDQATREYLNARREAMLQGPQANRSGWAGAAAIKARELANARAIQAKNRAWRILVERGFLDRQPGLAATEPD